MIRLLFSDAAFNRLDISHISKYEGAVKFNQLALKYVYQGKETYFINGKKHEVNTGEYLLANQTCLSEASVNINTTGLCIDVSTELIREITNFHFNQDDFLNYLLNDSFFVSKYHSKNSAISAKLKGIIDFHQHEHIQNSIDKNFFYELGECLVLEQFHVFQQISRLEFKTHFINSENYKKLKDAKEYIDTFFLNEIMLEQLSQVACMSKYRFVRLFKQAFKITPYQYILCKRLNFAKDLIVIGKSVSEAAFSARFADLPSFSKAFKSHFKISPSKLI